MNAYTMLAIGLLWPVGGLAFLGWVGKAIDNAERRRTADLAAIVTAERER